MARRKPPTTHGFLLLDKPAGITSHDLVGKVRHRFNERQVGHAGTLDPDATGLLLVGVGKATRLLTFLVGMDKTYIGQVVFGVSTSTLDAAGEVLARYEMGELPVDSIRQVIAANLHGDIMQVPPMVSALKVDGKRLHQLAREGIEVERQPRPVRIDRFNVSTTNDPMCFDIEVDCSSGTYIRSLADDLGRLMGGGAYLGNLRRIRIGPFHVRDATSVDDAVLLSPIAALPHLQRVSVNDEIATMVKHGRVLEKWDGQGPWIVCDENGELLAVYEMFRDSQAKPAVVIAEQEN